MKWCPMDVMLHFLQLQHILLSYISNESIDSIECNKGIRVLIGSKDCSQCRLFINCVILQVVQMLFEVSEGSAIKDIKNAIHYCIDHLLPFKII